MVVPPFSCSLWLYNRYSINHEMLEYGVLIECQCYY